MLITSYALKIESIKSNKIYIYPLNSKTPVYFQRRLARLYLGKSAREATKNSFPIRIPELLSISDANWPVYIKYSGHEEQQNVYFSFKFKDFSAFLIYINPPSAWTEGLNPNKTARNPTKWNVVITPPSKNAACGKHIKLVRSNSFRKTA